MKKPLSRFASLGVAGGPLSTPLNVGRLRALALYVSASIHPISLYARSADQIWIAAYRLLGLSERDAVEAEKARLLKRYKARIKRLRADDAETHRIQMEVKDERIAALEAKNAALVDRIELALSMSEDIDINRILGNALAANEKGGVND